MFVFFVEHCLLGAKLKAFHEGLFFTGITCWVLR